MEEIIIDNFRFDNMEAQNYYSFSKAFKGDKKAKAKELCLSNRYMGSTKVDGAWNMIIKDNNGNYHLRSRKESVNGGFTDKAEWIPQICKELNNVPNGTVLIGEIYLPNNEGSRKITSILNCLKDKSLERQKENPLHFYIFDIIAYNGKSLIETPFEDRINKYLCGFSKKIVNPTYIEIAHYYEGEELWNLYFELIAAGREGMVITRKDCHYLCGKRTAWMTLKLKKELQDTIDAFIDGNYKPSTKIYNGKEIETWSYFLNEKTGEKYNTNMYNEYISGVPIVPITKAYYYGWASAISFSVMKNKIPTHIAWISNIPDVMKEGIVKNPEKWIGKVYELNAMQIEKINGQYSLRHGRIERVRDDKRPEDCLYSQIENN